jgi:hypothetical protein
LIYFRVDYQTECEMSFRNACEVIQ